MPWFFSSYITIWGVNRLTAKLLHIIYAADERLWVQHFGIMGISKWWAQYDNDDLMVSIVCCLRSWNRIHTTYTNYTAQKTAGTSKSGYSNNPKNHSCYTSLCFNGTLPLVHTTSHHSPPRSPAWSQPGPKSSKPSISRRVWSLRIFSSVKQLRHSMLL